MIDMSVIRDLTSAFGPSGFEEEVVSVIAGYSQNMDIVNDAMKKSKPIQLPQMRLIL